MKKFSTFYGLASLAVFLFIMSFVNVLAEVTEGTEYWFGIPYAKFKQVEQIRGDYPIIVWISSKVNTVARVIDPSGSIRNVTVKANKVSQVPLGDVLMNKESEVANDFGIHITSDDPISVSVYLTYQWTGEAYRVIPVDWLGKEYVTLNLYQDETDEMKPAQILIVATQDNTQVTYYPTFDTEKCNKGASRAVTLQKGQTFLILAKMTPGLTQDWSSDLTGTYIKATKPIGVISGHTKGAFPLYYVGYRSGWEQGYANFARNMLCDMMWPIELLGKEYVSAPLFYNNRVRGLSGVENDYGDLIRFVSTADGTKLFQMRQDGTSLMQIGPTLNKGQWYNITNQELPAYYRSNKPVLVGHYGKTWWNGPGMMGPKTTKEDQPQNPYMNGQGMMLVLAPIERWCTYATFRSPTDIDNFIYITFRYAERDNIYFDNQKITSFFGGGIKTINGTEYAYITEPVAAADHFIEGKNNSKFAGYAYGNWDREKDGFAYGYPIGMNFADPCLDSLYIQDNMVCGDVTGQAFAVDLQVDTSCAAIYTTNFNSTTSYNYIYLPQLDFKSGDKTFSFELKLMNINDSAQATIDIMTRSGYKVSKTYTYYPESVKVDVSSIDFGLMPLNQQKCKSFKITNPTKIPVTISEIHLKIGAPEFVITPFSLPYVLMPGDTLPVEVCATAYTQSTVPVRDSIIVKLTCYPQTIVGLQLSTGEPDIYISDADWGQVPVNQEKVQIVTIENRGIVNAELTTIGWTDIVHFTHTDFPGTPATPLVIAPGGQYSFNVYYKPDQVGVINTDSAYFSSNATKTKIYSLWKGIGIDVGPTITSKDWGQQRVIDEWQKAQTPPILSYYGQITLGCIGNTVLNVNDVVIAGDPDGVFSITRSQIPQKLSQDSPVTLDVYFAPSAEKVYEATITLISDFNGNTRTAVGTLKGIGIEPHISVDGHNFLPQILVGTTTGPADCLVHHLSTGDLFAMKLTLVKDFTIEGPDKDNFEIDPQWLTDHPMPITVDIGSTLPVPVRFHATKTGPHNAQLVAHSDAPSTDDHVGELTGLGYIEGINPTHWDFPIIYVTTTNSDGVVKLWNTGTTNVQVTRAIDKSLFSDVAGDADAFKVTDYYLWSDPTKTPTVPFTLTPTDTLFVKVSFTPLFEAIPYKSYKAYIDYQTDLVGITARSFLTGGGKVLRATAEIPKYADSPVKPGDQKEISFKFYTRVAPDTVESKPLTDGNIRSIVATVYYNQNNNVIDVKPNVANCGDITQSGTMTSNWTCDDAKILNNNMLQVTMHGPSALAAGSGDVLFKFRMNTFLSSRTDKPIDMQCMVTPVGQKAYIWVDSIPGNLMISLVCVNQLRLVQLANQTYSLSYASPNPVTNTATIDYSVGFSGRTTIIIFNEFGEVVATLLDQNLAAGSYQLSILTDALGLASGTYYVKMDSGPFSDTKALVIVK